MTRAVDVSDIIDTRGVGAFQLRAFLLCAAVLFVDGFDVQGITYVVPTITQEWGLVRGDLWPALTGLKISRKESRPGPPSGTART